MTQGLAQLAFVEGHGRCTFMEAWNDGWRRRQGPVGLGKGICLARTGLFRWVSSPFGMARGVGCEDNQGKESGGGLRNRHRNPGAESRRG